LTRSVTQLDHVFITIPVNGEDEGRRFYGGLLGLEEMTKPAGLAESPGVWFQAGQGEVHLGVDGEHAASRRPHPGFRVESVSALEELAHRLEGAGCEVSWDERIEGRKRFYTRDPFGNRLELLADLSKSSIGP
jgi:catechol 2,3-dioxygenase-like lactoylglutathione lyase family enzyme